MSGCGGGSGGGCGCSCGGNGGRSRHGQTVSALTVDPAAPVARINGIALHAPDARPPEDELRQRVTFELLRQAAQREGLLDARDVPYLDGSLSTVAGQAIDTLLERTLRLPDTEDETQLQSAWVQALRQYLRELAGQARLDRVDFEVVESAAA
jgi:peptidyl-prolyl cis-trans isomerase C